MKKQNRRKPNKKNLYRVNNWSEYNKALKQRGSLEVWISDQALAEWEQASRTGRPGRPFKYPDTVIATMCVLKQVYKQTLRGLEGFVESLFRQLKLHLPVPDYSTISRRQGKLQVPAPTVRGQQVIAIDSTGIKVIGEGEWKVRQHGWSYRRGWRKLHLALTPEDGQIVGAVVSHGDSHDSQYFQVLLDQVEGEIISVKADGAYDNDRCYRAVAERGGRAIIPPRRNAKIKRRRRDGEEPLPRDENIRQVRKMGRKKWKEENGYHQRSLAESAISRFKRVLSDRVSSRRFENQAVELFTGCGILNRMFDLGRPESYKVTL